MDALWSLSSKCREVGDVLANAVECLMWEMDRERRGAMCAAARQDDVEVASTIEDLLKGDLLNAKSREDLHARVREMLKPQPEQPVDDKAGA
jgi:hypothetical protein